jgi:hypothetical protein
MAVRCRAQTGPARMPDTPAKAGAPASAVAAEEPTIRVAPPDPPPDPVAPYGMSQAALGTYDVIDRFGLDFYVGKALEFILQHRQDAEGHAADLQAAQRLLDEKIKRLTAEARADRRGTGGYGAVTA